MVDSCLLRAERCSEARGERSAHRAHDLRLAPAVATMLLPGFGLGLVPIFVLDRARPKVMDLGAPLRTAGLGVDGVLDVALVLAAILEDGLPLLEAEADGRFAPTLFQMRGVEPDLADGANERGGGYGCLELIRHFLFLPC